MEGHAGDHAKARPPPLTHPHARPGGAWSGVVPHLDCVRSRRAIPRRRRAARRAAAAADVGGAPLPWRNEALAAVVWRECARMAGPYLSPLAKEFVA